MTGTVENEVRLHVYRRFVDDGRPPTAAETAEALGFSLADAEDAYRRLAEGRVVVLHPGTADIWMANPLSAVPTPFQVEVDGRSYFGNCAWDALGIPPMLGLDGRLHAKCPECDQPITLTVEGGSLRWADPGTALAHFSVPAAHWWDDIGYT